MTDPFFDAASRPSSSSSSSVQYVSGNANASWLPNKFPDSGDKFLDGPQNENMQESIRKYLEAVCQVVTPDETKRGSGFLIGPCLLLTNHHVLRDIETARQSSARFFKVVARRDSFDQKKILTEAIDIYLDPDRFFFTSPNRWVDETKSDGKKVKVPGDASEGYLDFTVVALRPAPHLSRTARSILSLFNTEPPSIFSHICVIQHPEVMKSGDVLKGALKLSYGQIKEVDDYFITYNAPALGGSSGGAVIDAKGHLIALHHQMKRVDPANPLSREYEYRGISVQKIASALIGQREAMEKANVAPLPPDLSQGTAIGLPATTNLFTGREEKLRDLEEKCSGEGKRVAVVGLGGIGKTALAVKYANDHQSDYSLICFIESGTMSQIENGLLNLVDVLEIRDENLERKLLALKTKLERSRDPVLLIFDGVDDEDSLAYLESFLPARGCNTILLSSRLRNSLMSFERMPLDSFSKEEAVDFLLKFLQDKDQDVEQAALLVKKLHCFPLALKHAAAFIKFTGVYTMRMYLEELDKEGFSLLGEEYVPHLGRNERTILTTWKKSIDVILRAPKGPLANELLCCFSVLANIPIPLDIVEGLTSAKRADRGVAIRLLNDYSLLEERCESYFLHVLVQKVIRFNLSDAESGYILKALNACVNCSKEWEVSNNQTRRRMDLYIPHFETVLESAKKLDLIDWSLIDTILMRLFCYYQADGKYEKAKRTAEDYLKICEERGASSLEKAKGLFCLGESLVELGNYGHALGVYEESLAIRKKYLGEQNPDVVKGELRRAQMLYRLRDSRETNEQNQHLMEIEGGEGTCETMNLDTVRKYWYRGATLGRQGKHEEALSCAMRALEICRKVLGEENLETAGGYRNVALLLSDAGDFEKTLIYDRGVLNVRLKVLGENHVKTAESYHNIGVVLDKLGRHEEALTYYRRELEIQKEISQGNDDLKQNKQAYDRRST